MSAAGLPRVVSLVPSVTEAIAALGAAEALVGVTDWCQVGAPAHAVRVGGTKNPSLAKIRALRPDVVVVNREENRREDAEALEADGLTVLATHPQRVADVPALLRQLGELVDRLRSAERWACQIEHMLELTPARMAGSVLTLVWRKPWMAVAPGTYAHDLLSHAGFRNVLTDASEPYPTLSEAPGEQPHVVLLPTEPYHFTPRDLDAVRELVGPEPQVKYVNGQLLTWHGVRTPNALNYFSGLAAAIG